MTEQLGAAIRRAQLASAMMNCCAPTRLLALVLVLALAKTLQATVDDHLAPAQVARGPEALKVAALAARLEQWLLCRRLHLLGGLSGGLSGASGHARAAHCPAHFDGHLCWPASEPGQPVQRPCPRLLLLDAVGEPSPAPDEANLTRAGDVGGGGGGGSLALEPTGDNQSPAKAPRRRQEEPAMAQRSCLRLEADTKTTTTLDQDNLMLANGSRPHQWEPEADYSKCRGGDDASFDPADKWIKLDDEHDRRLFEALAAQLDRLEPTIDPYSELGLLEQWTLCIGNIMRQQRMTAGQAQPPAGDPWCPIIFDGWRCWPSTRAGDTAYVSCPGNQPGFSAERKAHKICTPTGDWYKHPMTNRYWSNYTTCVDTVDLAFRTKILNLYVIGNLISLVALMASMIIFISFKSLKCTRVTIHKNLFLSFITNNLMWIIWYTCVVNDASLLQTNPLQCQLWHILLHYFLVSNYFWMFCEGLYLHTLLVVAFVSEDKILKWFYLLGWLTPLPITVAYAYNRSYDAYYTNFCWMEESPYNLILMAPIGISLLLNLVFLINIVRVLVTKLRANNSPDTHQTRKAVRATLILIPLLGLHYILTPFRPEAKSEWEVIYEIVAAVCTSFQGLCVALLFCFCNGEVIAVIKKKLKDTFNLGHHRQPSPGEAQLRARSNTGASLIAATPGPPPHHPNLFAAAFHHHNNNSSSVSVSASCLSVPAGLMMANGHQHNQLSTDLKLQLLNQTSATNNNGGLQPTLATASASALLLVSPPPPPPASNQSGAKRALLMSGQEDEDAEDSAAHKQEESASLLHHHHRHNNGDGGIRDCPV